MTTYDTYDTYGEGTYGGGTYGGVTVVPGLPPDPVVDWECGDEGSLETIEPFYSQDPFARTNLPFSCDCSGLVWWNYNQLGIADALFPSYTAGVSEHIAWFEASNWRMADLLLRWNENTPNSEAQTVLAREALNDRVFVDGVEDVSQAFLQRGDLLYRCDSPSGEGDHVAWFVGWKDVDSLSMNVLDAHPLSTPVVGYRYLSYDYVVSTFTHAVRPMAIGKLTYPRYAAAVPKAV